MNAAETEAAVELGIKLISKLVEEVMAVANASAEHTEAERAAMVASIKARLGPTGDSVAAVVVLDV